MNTKIKALIIGSFVSTSVIIATALYPFIFDNQPPEVLVQNPGFNVYYDEPILVRIIAWDNMKIDTIWYNWNGIDEIYTTEIYIDFTPGLIKFEVFANDTSGNIRNNSVLFTILDYNDNFSIVIDTTKSTVYGGTTETNQFKLGFIGKGFYQCIVDWGDNTRETVLFSLWTNYSGSEFFEVIHTYPSPGVYSINITGTVQGWSLWGDKVKLLEIKRWGALKLVNVGNYFYGCSNLVITATDAPDVSGITNFRNAFSKCDVLVEIPGMNDWDMSHATDMENMFLHSHYFNQNISKWDVSRVTNMKQMFYMAENFNQDISNWNVSKVTTMTRMFYGAFSFNQDINRWDVSNVLDMTEIFFAAINFNSCLNLWNVSNLIDMSYMFLFAKSFNQNINAWDTSNVVCMESMFYGATSFNQDISDWNVSNVRSLNRMFVNATSFDQNISKWDVSKIEHMEEMFSLVTISTLNYDSILIGWSQQDVLYSITFDAGYSKYSAGDAKAARDILTETYGWHITDGGQAP